MSERNDGGPAFPAIENGKTAFSEQPVEFRFPGMSLRDYLAAKAMQGLVSACDSEGGWTGAENGGGMNKVAAEIAYQIADVMLEERDK